MTKDKIEARIKELEQQRELFLNQANATIQEFNGRIDELKLLLKEDDAVTAGIEYEIEGAKTE